MTNTESKIALIGAAGMIGQEILKQLLADKNTGNIRLILRKALTISDPRVEQRIIDFGDRSALRDALSGCDILFCSVGTTQKKVQGDQAAYRKVDYDIPVQAAELASEMQCRKFLLVSAIGADSRSRNFYSRLKGEVEEAVSALPFESIHFFQPSLLLGDRNESRPLERLSQILMPMLKFLIPSPYKAIQASDVAAAMIFASRSKEKGLHRWRYKEMMGVVA